METGVRSAEQQHFLENKDARTLQPARTQAQNTDFFEIPTPSSVNSSDLFVDEVRDHRHALHLLRYAVQRGPPLAAPPRAPGLLLLLRL